MGTSLSRGRAGAPIVIGLVLAAWFIWLFAAALHLPQAHELPVALVAPDAVAAKVTAGLEQQAPGAFSVTSYGAESEARAAIADRGEVGAFVAGANGATILVASGASEATAAAVAGAFTAVAGAMQLAPTIEDVVPLPADDPHGTVPFFLVLGVSLSALIYAVIAYASGATGSLPGLGERLASLVAFAVLDGLVAAAAVGLVLGFDENTWLLAAVCAVLALAVASATAALQELAGTAGSGLAALFVVILGAACSGAMAGPWFLPDGFRALAPILPPGVGLAAARSTLYFDGAALGVPLVTLAAWAAVALGIVVAVDLWRHRPVTRPVPSPVAS
jgi:hypothetical protein